MGLFSSPPPSPPPPPPIPPAANPPVYASGETMTALSRRNQAKPMAGTDLTTGSGQREAQVMQTAALGLGGGTGAGKGGTAV
jgi:hypothetical protein